MHSIITKVVNISGAPGWPTQSTKPLTPGLGSGHDLKVCEIKPHVVLTVSGPYWYSLSPSLSAPPLCSYSVSLSK